MSAPLSKTRGTRRLAAVLASLLLAGCEPPPVDPAADPRQDPTNAGSRIEGQVVVTGHTRGNVVLFLFDAANPPPPQGRGRPLTFNFIPEQALYGTALADGSQSGPFTAPFTFSRVLPGNYLITGIIDHDECVGSTDTQCHPPDFDPWFSVTDEPNALDVGGAAVDAATHAMRVVQIETATDPTTGATTLVPATGVTVSFTDQQAFPVDRPAFKVADPGTFSLSTGLKLLPLATHSISGGTVNEANPVFLVRYVDDNNDGKPDTDRNGNPEFWPKVVVRKVNEANPLQDEMNGLYLRADGTLSGTGVVVFPGISAPPQLTTLLAADMQVVLGAGTIPPSAAIAALNDSGGAPRRDTNGNFISVPVSSITVAVTGAAFDISNPAVPPVPLKTAPTGHYAVYIINPTGQTWRLPNELASTIAPSLQLSAVDGQDFVLTVTP